MNNQVFAALERVGFKWIEGNCSRCGKRTRSLVNPEKWQGPLNCGCGR